MERVTSELPMVNVQFSSRNNPEGYSAREYTYITSIPLQVGDIVKAPTKRGIITARVSTVDHSLISEPTFELQTITEMYDEDMEDDKDE